MMDQSDNLSVLFKVSEVVAKSSDLEEAIIQVMEMLAQKERGEYKIGEGIIGEVVKTGEPVIIPHISDEPRYLNKTRSTTKLKDEDSFICVPIKAKNQIIGTLSVKLKYYSSSTFQNEL